MFDTVKCFFEISEWNGFWCSTQFFLIFTHEIISSFCFVQVPRNKLAHAFVLQSLDTWPERFLIASNNQRVRTGETFISNYSLQLLICQLGCILCIITRNLYYKVYHDCTDSE